MKPQTVPAEAGCQTNQTRAMSRQDQQHLREFERARDLIRDRTQAVAQHHHTGAFLVGRPGTSKTVTVEDTLRRLDLPWTLWNARISPMGLWLVMQENPESVIVIDDVSTLFCSSNKAALQVLLAGLGGEPGQPRQVKYATKDDRVSFSFSGGLIAIGNELPRRDPVADALLSRIPVLHHDPSDAMIGAFMRDQAKRGYKDIGPRECAEVVEFVIAESRAAEFRLDLRHMRAAWEDFRFWKSGSRHDWKTLVRSSMQRLTATEPILLDKQQEIEQDRQRVKSAIKQHPDDLKKQIEASGLKRSTFFLRRKEVRAVMSSRNPGIRKSSGADVTLAQQ